MRTTIRIDDELLRKLKEQSARTGRSVGALIEDAVRAALNRREGDRTELRSLPTYGGSGVLPGVDLSSPSALLDEMDQGEPIDALR
jgi:plasmid stability protein